MYFPYEDACEQGESSWGTMLLEKRQVSPAKLSPAGVWVVISLPAIEADNHVLFGILAPGFVVLVGIDLLIGNRINV